MCVCVSGFSGITFRVKFTDTCARRNRALSGTDHQAPRAGHHVPASRPTVTVAVLAFTLRGGASLASAAATSGASTATVGNASASVCHLGIVTVDDDVGAARNGVTIEEKPGVFDGCVRF